MGVDFNACRLILHARNKYQANFGRTATIGRMGFCAEDVRIFNLLEKCEPFRGKMGELVTKTRQIGNYSESFFEGLGASTVESFDGSGYEGATHVHDFNLPIDSRFYSGYDFVFEGGTLEHIFNVPQAVLNIMKMLKVGGTFASLNMANNHFGHGFYQFSPEFYLRCFSPANGFELLGLWIAEEGYDSNFYAVKDPIKIHSRVALINSKRTFILALARKVEDKEIFKVYPQQGDYEHSEWLRPANEASTSTLVTPALTSRAKLKQLIPASILRLLRSAKDRIQFERSVKDFAARSNTGNRTYYLPEGIDQSFN